MSLFWGGEFHAYINFIFFVLSPLAEKSTDVDVKEHGKSVFSFLSSAKQLAAVHSDDL